MKRVRRRLDDGDLEPIDEPAHQENGHEPEAPTAWDRVMLARHPERPHTLDYIRGLMQGFVELHGDRQFGDDAAIIGGLASFNERTVIVLGHQKGTTTRENIERNFGMAKPEGYRKVDRLMKHAEKFGIPVITFVDTPGAEPGIGSEERGQGTAIAESLLTMASLKTPVIAVIVGEGGSGGALAIGMADRMLMLENAIYAVASPEACAAILWKDASKAPEAAQTMRITADDLYTFGIVDTVVDEAVPANEEKDNAIAAVGAALESSMAELMETVDQPSGIDRLVEQRYEKYRQIGAWQEAAPIG